MPISLSATEPAIDLPSSASGWAYLTITLTKIRCPICNRIYNRIALPPILKPYTAQKLTHPSNNKTHFFNNKRNPLTNTAPRTPLSQIFSPSPSPASNAATSGFLLFTNLYPCLYN